MNLAFVYKLEKLVLTLEYDNKEHSKAFVLSQESTHKIKCQELHWVHTTWGANLYNQVVEGPYFWFSSASIRPAGGAQGDFVWVFELRRNGIEHRGEIYGIF